jgi:hypothetical protein
MWFSRSSSSANTARMSTCTYLSLGCVEGRRLPILADGKGGWWSRKYDKEAMMIVVHCSLYRDVHYQMMNSNNSVYPYLCPAERWQIYFLNFWLSQIFLLSALCKEGGAAKHDLTTSIQANNILLVKHMIFFLVFYTPLSSLPQSTLRVKK